MNWHPICYPKLTREVADSINDLLTRDEPIEVATDQAVYSIQPCAALGLRDTCISLRMEVGGRSTGVHLSPATFEAVLMDLISRQCFEALDDDLQLAVLEAALAEPLVALAKHLQTPVTFQEITAVRTLEAGSATDARDTSEERALTGQPEFAPNSILFEVCRQTDQARYMVRVDLMAALPEPARSVLNDTAAKRHRDFSRLPAPVLFEVGRASLPISEFRTLEPGDIILFDECYISAGQLRVNIGDRIFYQGDVDGLDLAIRNN